MKTSGTVLGEKELKKKDSKSTSKNLNSAQKLPKVNENKSEKSQPAGAEPTRPRKVTLLPPACQVGKAHRLGCVSCCRATS